MGKKVMVFLIILTIISMALWLAFRVGYFVLDRNVFGFQINPIVRNGEIKNINQYRIVHNYVEMKFEEDPDTFENNPLMKKLDKMMGEFH
ncbi:hypothetical protein IMCC1989_2334 [gamma proteobacterium IMCC1989]|nr:hypothetical protein IMCC1989_2334 [gamma proteobacterium IMCC1989]